jgi:hypothetical protein
MSKVVPVGYILTNEAIKELVTADPKWRQLNDEWQRATGQAKQQAYRAACEIQDEITAALFAAAKSREVPAIALKRTAGGEWIEHILANEYLESLGGDMALWTGSVEGLGLDPSDQWISDAPLCFRRSDFDGWQARRAPQPAGAVSSRETYWTAIQAVEWIATRDRLAVTSAGSDLRTDALYGDDLREDITRSLAFHRILEEDTYQPAVVWRREALGLLIEACRSGQALAYGLERGAGESVEIPMSAWVHRTIADSPHGVACWPEDAFHLDATWWNRLRFGVAQVEALWPVPEPEVTQARRLAPSFQPHDIPPAYPMSLTRLAGCLRPRWCHAWLLAQDCVTKTREAERIRLRVAKRHPRMPAWERLPLELREQDARRKEIERRARLILEYKLKPAMLSVMARSDWVIRGLDSGGNEAVVPARLVGQLLLDLSAGSVSLADGSFVWRGVTVERAAPQQPAADRAPTTALPDAAATDSEILGWAKSVIERVVGDGRQLRRADFDAMLRMEFGVRLPPKAEDRFWSLAAPDGWRKQGQGKLPADRRVVDWRVYLEPQPDGAAEPNPPSLNPR